jgi:two-component system chemotaxis response regulator CheY
MRTLIVDAEPASRRLLEVLVSPLGPCDAAGSGTEGVAALERALTARKPYGLVFVDLRLPGMDGKEALRLMRTAEAGHGIGYGAGARVVMTSAATDTRSVSLAFGAMCDAFLVKPLVAAKLFEALRELNLDAGLPKGLTTPPIVSLPPRAPSLAPAPRASLAPRAPSLTPPPRASLPPRAPSLAPAPLPARSTSIAPAWQPSGPPSLRGPASRRA